MHYVTGKYKKLDALNDYNHDILSMQEITMN